MIKHYVKKPIEIEAVQFDGKNLRECFQFMSDKNIRLTSHWNDKECCRGILGEYDPIAICINTLEGEMRCDIGDYIIKGVNGEFYPCKPDIFEKTYDPVI